MLTGTKFTHRLVTNAGSEVGYSIWNATSHDIAAAFEVEETEIDISEDEDGNEVVYVSGNPVGLMERM